MSMKSPSHNVLLVKGNYLRAGGPETLLTSTFRHLDRSRFRPTLVVLKKAGGPEAPGLVGNGSIARRDIAWRGIGGAPLAARCLHRMIREQNGALIDTHDMRANLAAYLLCRFRRAPWIARVHGWLGFTHSGRWRLYERVEKSLVKHADLVLVGCEAAKREVEALGIRSVQVVRQGIEIPPPVPVEEVQRIRDQVGAISGTVIVGVSGRLHPGKGQAFLLRAVALLRARGLDVRGVIVGEGPSLEILQKLTEELSLEGIITFPGFQLNLMPYVAAMDIFVAPSLKEGLSLAALEAMALGRPVVASGVGGLLEAVADGISGILVPPGNVSALADALEPLVADPAARRRMGERARQIVRAEFSAEGMVRSLEAVYRDMMGGIRGYGCAD